MKSFIFFGILFFQQLSMAEVAVSLKGLPPVKSYQESREQRPLRAERFFDYYLAKPLAEPPSWPKGGMQDFTGTMLSRMVRHQDLAAVSENILKPDFQPWLTGTDFALVGTLCERRGDYDFVLQGLVKIAYTDREAGKTLLSEEARQKLYNVLLSEKGNEHHDKISIGGCITVKDTENHILMTETARYLTNQIMLKECHRAKQECSIYDNEKNGFNGWLLDHLANFLKNDFSEFNSRPYEGYTVTALGNIYTYAENPAVKRMAQMVLDYLAAKFAMSTNGMRRLAPFRRQKWVVNHNFLHMYDDVVFRAVLTVGNYEFLKYMNNGEDPGDYTEDTYLPFSAAMETYQIPDLILDTQINKETSYLQKIRHTDVELYTSSKSFLLTAGGRWRDVADYLTGENDAWGVATTIIPTQGEYQLKNLFYFLGEQKASDRNNMCVTKNFACGQNMHIPENLPESCRVQRGKWTFYNLKDCPLNYGFYVAAYKDKPMPEWDDRNQNFGLFEVHEADIKFDNFMNTVLQKNPTKNFRPNRSSRYETFDGTQIEFYFYALGLGSYPITKINGEAQQTDFSKWNRAEGDLMNSSVPGRIEIYNKRLGQRLILDATNSKQPIRELLRRGRKGHEAPSQ